MHPLAAGAVTGSVIKRASQGDCPTEPAHSVETLEEALIEVNRLFQAEQKVREQLEVALRKHHTGIGCVNYCRTCGGHFSWQDDSRAVSFESDAAADTPSDTPMSGEAAACYEPDAGVKRGQ